jgi:hypothetical protein
MSRIRIQEAQKHKDPKDPRDPRDPRDPEHCFLSYSSFF